MVATVTALGSTRPLRRDAAENRVRVLTAAAEVFDEHGLGAGLDDVARRAGVGVGTVYRRFSTREALLEALLVDLLATYATEAERALALLDGEGLASYLRTVGEVQATSRGCALRLWSASAAPAVEAHRAQLREQMRQLLDQAVQHGACRDDVTVSDLVGILIGARGVREASARSADLDWRRHLELCLAGLRPSG